MKTHEKLYLNSKRFHEELNKKGLNKFQFSKQTGLPPQSLSEWCLHRTAMSRKSALRLSKALSLELSELVIIKKVQHDTKAHKLNKGMKINKTCQCGSPVTWTVDDYDFGQGTICRTCYLQAVDNYQGELV